MNLHIAIATMIFNFGPLFYPSLSSEHTVMEKGMKTLKVEVFLSKTEPVSVGQCRCGIVINIL